MTARVKEALCQSDINVQSLIEQLSTISAVKHKKVPLFDDNIFDKVMSIDELWTTLRLFWAVYDYDLLIFIIELTKCAEAKEILDEFEEMIDPYVLEDVGLVLQHKVIEEGNIPQHILRVKVNTEYFRYEKVKGVVSKHFDLEKYSLYFKVIKEGCVELLCYISTAMMSYLSKFKITSDMMADFASHDIVNIQINNMELKIKSNMVSCT